MNGRKSGQAAGARTTSQALTALRASIHTLVGITSVSLRPKCFATPEAYGLGMCPALQLFTVQKLRGPTPEPHQVI